MKTLLIFRFFHYIWPIDNENLCFILILRENNFEISASLLFTPPSNKHRTYQFQNFRGNTVFTKKLRCERVMMNEELIMNCLKQFLCLIFQKLMIKACAPNNLLCYYTENDVSTRAEAVVRICCSD